MFGISILYRAICKISLFVICAEMLIQLRAKEKYEKYLKVCLALMIMGMFMRQFSHTSELDAVTYEIGAMDEKLRSLNEEEMEQAIDIFWEQLLLEERRGQGNAGEREEDVH